MSIYVTDELKSWIGREATYTAPEELGQASIRYFAMALGDDNPLFQRRGVRAQPPVTAPSDRATNVDLRDQPAFEEPTGRQRLYRPRYGRFRCPAIASCAAAMNTNSISRSAARRSTSRCRWRLVDIYERETSRAGVGHLCRLRGSLHQSERRAARRQPRNQHSPAMTIAPLTILSRMWRLAKRCRRWNSMSR